MTSEKPHLFGWRVIDWSDEDYIYLSLVLMGPDGNPIERVEPQIFFLAANEAENYVERDLAAVLANAVCRYFNAGANNTTALQLVQNIVNATNDFQLTPNHSLVAIEEEVTFSTLYEDSDGNFTRVVQDAFTEELSYADVIELYGLTSD